MTSPTGPGPASYMNRAPGELPFCPGCGHTPLLRALDRALVELAPNPRQVVVVSDIGCIGLSDRFFETNSFHGLHGRALTYASGLKLARPELMVIVLMGDGGCGIGGTHLLSAARRNIDLTLLVANNFNYGMTGGQHSVTTPVGGITASTPLGNFEAPIDLCATAAAAGAPWVHRATMFDDDLHDTIARAVRQPGFSMVEVLELCTAYYAPRNELLKRKQLLAMAARLPLGQLADQPRDEYTSLVRAQAESLPGPREPASSTASFASELEREVGIVIAGSAGQKIRSTTTLLARAAMSAGLSVSQKDDFPITVQTGHSISELIVSPAPIDYTGIDCPEHVVLLSEHGLARTRSRVQALPETSTVWAGDELELGSLSARVRRLPLGQLRREVGRESLAMAVIASLVAHIGMVPIAALTACAGSTLPGAFASSATRAIERGASTVCR